MAAKIVINIIICIIIGGLFIQAVRYLKKHGSCAGCAGKGCCGRNCDSCGCTAAVRNRKGEGEEAAHLSEKAK